MKLKIIKPFKFAHRGIQVEEFTADTEVDATEECAEVALAEGWAVKAEDCAPENKDAGGKRKTKA